MTPDGEVVILHWDVVPRFVSNAVALLGTEGAVRRVAVLLEMREGSREGPPQMIFMLLAAGGLGSRSSGHFRPGSVCMAAVAAVYALALPRVAPAAFTSRALLTRPPGSPQFQERT